MTPKSSPSPAVVVSKRGRWQPKSPVDLFAGKADRLRRTIEAKEAEVNDLRRQLEQFEQAIKIFEK